MTNNFIYFDYSSTSPLTDNVLDSIKDSYKNYWGNTSSTYNFGIRCAEELERTRCKIASILNANNEDVVFTSGSTESIALVFNNISDKYENGSITISAVEHQATIIASNKLVRKGWEINEWPVDNEGIIKMNKSKNFINKKTKLVSMIWGQSEIGSIQPIQKIGNLCKEKGILFHVDATQIVSNGIFNWRKLSCDYLSLSAHKFGGPKGIGILLTKKRSRKYLMNNDISKSHENKIRAGTQALPLITGLYQALINIQGEIIATEKETEFKKINTNLCKDYLVKKFLSNDKIEITGSPHNRLPNHISFVLLNKKCRPIEAYKIVNYMSDNNIAISSGSACSSNSKKPSKVLKNCKFKKSKLFSNIRVSFGKYNTLKEVDKFYDLILECIEIF